MVEVCLIYGNEINNFSYYIIMTSFLLPLAARVIDRALEKLPGDAELGELLVNTALHILKKAVSMTSTKVDDELYAVVEKALANRD